MNQLIEPEDSLIDWVLAHPEIAAKLYHPAPMVRVFSYFKTADHGPIFDQVGSRKFFLFKMVRSSTTREGK